MAFRVLDSTIWRDRRFRTLAALERLALLFTEAGPLSHFSGLSRIVASDVAEACNCSGKAASVALERLHRVGLIVSDPFRAVVFVPGALSRQVSKMSPNHRRGIESHLERMPAGSRAVAAFLAELREIDPALIVEYHEAPEEAPAEAPSEAPAAWDASQENREQGEGKGTGTGRGRGCASGAPPRPASPSSSPGFDLSDLWNIETKGVLPACSKFTASRRSKAMARLKSFPDPEWWRLLLAKIIATPFLIGENERGWKANFDWLVRSDDVPASVMEGKYDSGPKGGGKPPAEPKSFDAIRSFMKRHGVEGDDSASPIDISPLPPPPPSTSSPGDDLPADCGDAESDRPGSDEKSGHSPAPVERALSPELESALEGVREMYRGAVQSECRKALAGEESIHSVARTLGVLPDTDREARGRILEALENDIRALGASGEEVAV